MAGASGSIPDFEVNFFGQLCKPAHRPSATAGTSGCVPDFEVNVFGQLCKPAPRPSSTPSSPEDQEPDIDVQAQPNGALLASTCITDQVPTPDPISDLFQKHQLMIRSLSGGNVETFIATVKDVFKEVSQSRRDDRAGLVKSQQDNSARCFVIRHYEQNEDEATSFFQEQEKRKGDGVCSHVIM